MTEATTGTLLQAVLGVGVTVMIFVILAVHPIALSGTPLTSTKGTPP